MYDIVLMQVEEARRCVRPRTRQHFASGDGSSSGLVCPGAVITSYDVCLENAAARGHASTHHEVPGQA